MATKLKVTYVDGREVPILASPRAQVETSRHFKSEGGITDANDVEAGYHLAWASLHYAGREPADFETWLDLVADVDRVELTADDEKATDPTPVTPTSTGSSS